MPAVTLELVQRGDALALEVVERREPELPPSSVDERIAAVLAGTSRPVSLAELRAACRVRTATLCDRLAALTAQGRLAKVDAGYRRCSRRAGTPRP